jgi:hypothetical protein
MKRLITAIFVSWILFIGIDFVFHAGIFPGLWKEEIPAIKSLEDLAILIPAGYGSFLLLTALIAYIFHKIFKEKPSLQSVWKFAFIFGGLFSLSNLFGLYSYVEIPLKQLIAFNLVYFIEIVLVTFSIHYLLFTSGLRKQIIRTVVIFILLIVLGVVFQNILQ